MKTRLQLFLMLILLSFKSFAFDTVKLTGTGVGGWDVPGHIALSTTDGVTYTATNFQLISDLNVKFSINDSWGTTGGFTSVAGWPSGTASLTGTGANIVGVSGFWNVTFNLTTGDYAFTAGVNPNRIINFTGAGLVDPVGLVTTDNTSYKKESLTFVTGGAGSFEEVASPVHPTGPFGSWKSSAFPSGTGTSAGASIPVTPGTYIVTLNANTGAYDFIDTVVSLIGVNGDWVNDVDMTSTDNINYTYNSLVITSGDLKFRDNHSWNFNHGSSTPASLTGTCVVNGGSNIAVPPGTYNVTFNRTTMAYAFVSLNANFEFQSTGVTPNPVTLGTTDGVNYVGNSVVLTAASASGKFQELVSLVNTAGPYLSVSATTPAVLRVTNIAFNKTTKAFSFPFVVESLIGVNDDWNTDLDMTTTDGITYTYSNLVITKGKLKFRDGHGWAFNHGSSTPTTLTGTCVVNGGSDIAIPVGTYNVTFNRTTMAYAFTSTLATNKFSVKNFGVYPNPTQNSWNFTSSNEVISSINVMDVLGRTVITKNVSAKEVSVDASSLTKGVYFAKIASGTSNQTIKVIKD